MLSDLFPTFSFLLATGSEAVKIPLAMLVVFGTAKLMAELFERLGQPGIVGEIFAGILIGPSVLNWIQPGGLLSALADLGVMFLLFRVGLEVKSSDLMRVGGTATVVAVLGVLMPLALGWGIMLLWGGSQIESLFVGAAMVATSVGITAQVLAAGGWLDAKASKIILAAAVIDDVLGLLVLAVVNSMAKGKVDLVELGFSAAVAVAFTVIVVMWGTKTMERLVPRVTENMRLEEAQFALAMVLLFALSLAAVYAGVAAIIGAFLAGVALAESIGKRVKDLAHGVTELLLPFFLAGIGLHVDLFVFTETSTLVLALVILAAAILSKFVGCGLGAIRLGRAEVIRIGVGMIPRGEVGMVVAQIGLGLGVLPKDVYGIVVFMSVATTMVAPPLLKLAYRSIGAKEASKEPVFRLG